MTINLNPANYPPPDSHVGAPLADPEAGSRDQPLAVRSPEWWLERLLKRLIDQADYCAAHYAFYEGRQPLAFASAKFVAAYADRYRNLPANFMPLVIDAERERLIVQGFRFGGEANDNAAWRIWQENDLDGESQIAHELTLSKGVSYALVTPQGSGTPLITIEDAEQCVIETMPGNRRTRLAALKAWRGEDGFLRAYLFLPDEVYKWRSKTRANLSASGSGGVSLGSDAATNQGNVLKASSWVPELPDGEDFPLRNELGVVPLIPLLNRPTLQGQGRSEIAPVIGSQNAINFIRFSALIGSDQSALPQRWAKNLDLEVDENTGTVKLPYRPNDILWTTKRPGSDETAEYGDKYPETDFGQFPGADLSPFTTLIRSEISQMASISRTPYHYLLGEPSSVPPTGESIKSSEAPLVKKVVAAEVHIGEGWEETLRVALIATGQTKKARADAQTIWTDPETRNEGARTDAIIKQYQVGLLSDAFALEQLGYSPQDIKRIADQKAAEQKIADAEAAANPPPPPAPPGSADQPPADGNAQTAPTPPG